MLSGLVARVTLKHGRLQEAACLGKGTRSDVELPSRRQTNPPVVRHAAKSAAESRRPVDPANIVEGRRQSTDCEFARFLRIALNSGVEPESHLIAARDIGAITAADSDAVIRQVVEVRKMLYGLIKRLGEPPA